MLSIYMASNGRYAYEYIRQRSWDVPTLKAYSLRDAPEGFTFNNSTLCHTVLMCFVVT